jgi:D-3-phosphoglycerate dehydrogenase
MSASKVRVLIADSMNPVARKMLEGAGGFAVDDRAGISAEELVREIPEYEVLIVRSRTKVTPKIMEAAKKLKIIGRAGIGVDNIDVKEATSHGFIVMNAPNGNSVSAAELAIAHIVSLSRNLVGAGGSMAQGKWEKKKFMGREVSNSTMGIIGLGNIGQIVVDRAKGLKMRVVGFDPFVSEERMTAMGIEYAGDLGTLLSQTDFLTIHTPLTEKTRYLIGAKEFKQMKPDAFLINCARGGIVDEGALLNALNDGEIAGAALDVFESEPPKDNPLLEHPNVYCTPHLGASTREAQILVASELAEQIVDYFVRNVVRSAVNLPRVQADEQAALWPYVLLAQRLGAFAGQYHDGTVDKVDVTYYGDEFQEGGVAMVTNAVLQGVLTSGLDTPVNLVNAPILAKNRGIEATEHFESETDTFTRLISVRVSGGKVSHEIRGTIYGENDARIVQVDDYNVEAVPEGTLLISRNKDVPGIIGKIGTLLGGVGVNVSGLQVSPPRKGQKQALSIWQLESEIPEKTLSTIREVADLHACTQIHI